MKWVCAVTVVAAMVVTGLGCCEAGLRNDGGVGGSGGDGGGNR